MSDHTVPSRFARSGSTVRFDHGASPVTLTVCTSRIVRVELADERDAAGPSYVGPRSWAAVPFEIIDGERVRLSTGDLRVEAATSPVRLTFLDAAGAWLLREPAHGGMITESLGDTRRRVRASFEFSDERHFYGLGQGEDAEELGRLARAIREMRIPCGGLIYLSTYGEAQGWNRGVGHLGFQPALWPDPPARIEEARRQHFEIITHEYPVLHEDSPLFAEAEASGYLLDDGYGRSSEGPRRAANYREGQRYLDFSNPAVGAWWWSAHRELATLGVAGWWLDGGEGPPATAKLHAGDGTLLHNIYDRFRHEAFARGEAADRPDQRVFLLCRSGAAGMQRFGATCWSGDINNDFATLEAQIPLGLNTGLSGVPYWGTGVGRFF